MLDRRTLSSLRQKTPKPASLRNNTSGMVQNRAEAFLPASAAVDIINMHATDEGSWSADRAGYSVVNSGGTAYESGASIDGLFWFTGSDGADHLFTAINGKLKEVDLTAGTDANIDASAGYTVGNQVDFEVLGNVLFSCDGAIATPRKWDGTTAANSGGWPVNDGSNTYSKPKFVENHQDRLLYLNFQGGTGAATKYESHAILSNQNAGEAFTLPATTAAHAYIAQIGPGDGQVITGARSIHIPATNKAQSVIFKERSTYALIGSSGKASDSDAFNVVKMNGGYGAFNNRSIVQVGNDILALNEFGVTSYSSSTDSGTIQPAAIQSDFVKRIIDSLNYDYKHKCWAIHLPARREVWFALPTGANTVTNTILVYKYPSPGDPSGAPKWSRRSGFSPICGALYQKTFYTGFNDGIVGQMFNSSQYDDTGIAWRYEYPYLKFGSEKQIKRVLSGDAHFKVRSNQTATLQHNWKGGNNNDGGSRTLAVSTTVGGAVYGTGVYGTDYYGSQEEVKAPFNIHGNGERVKFTLSGTTNETGPEFLGITPAVEAGAVSQFWN